METAVAEQIESLLLALEAAGVVPADGVEPDDFEDAVFDDAVRFAARPFAALADLHDPDGAPLFALAAPGSLATRAARACAAAGCELWDIAVVPDAADSLAGSARVRFSEWDVADVDFDGPSARFELGILAAIEARSL